MPSRRGSLRQVLCGLAALGSLAVVAPAAAQPGKPAGDVVYLKNGGIVRGTIIDAVPERSARVQLATGEISTIPWAEVDHIVTAGSAPPAAAPAPAPSSSSGAPPSTRDVAAVRLHVDAPRDVEVVGRQGDGYEWSPMCGGSCDKLVPVEWEYQVRGDGVKPSAPFLLHAERPGGVTLKVDPASNGSFVLGLMGVIGGGIVTPVGLLLLAVGASGHVTTTDSSGVQTTQPVGSGVLPAGIVVTTIGVAALVVGGLVALDNWSTGVRQQPAAGGPPEAGTAPPRFADVTREGLRLPPVASDSLVTLHF